MAEHYNQEDVAFAFESFCLGLQSQLLHKATLPDGTNVAVANLLFHVALFVNPCTVNGRIDYDCDHRYCYAHLDAALAAIRLYECSGIWVFWQKDHLNQISIKDGYLYKAGVYHTPENAFAMAGWNETEARDRIYRYYEVEMGPQRDRIWVHASDGSTVGRFSMNGIDMHNSVEDQLAGAPECRLCTHKRPTTICWALFREKAREWWYVDIPEESINLSLLSKQYK